MGLRRDVCRPLLRVFKDETAFINEVAKAIEHKRIKPKEAEKLIIKYYNAPVRLLSDLEQWSFN